MPSSTSSSSSSSNYFKRQAYCSSRFFFCHNLKRKNENNPTATSPTNMMTNLIPVLLFALDFVFELFLELVESSEKPEKRKQIGANCFETFNNLPRSNKNNLYFKVHHSNLIIVPIKIS